MNPTRLIDLFCALSLCCALIPLALALTAPLDTGRTVSALSAAEPIGDWLNVGGTDGKHPSGVAFHIRQAGIEQTIVDRAEMDAKLGVRTMVVWLYTGVRRDLHSGKIRFRYEPHPDLGDDWDEQFVRAVHRARWQHGVEVVPYLGKVGNCPWPEFEEQAAILQRAGVRRIIIDNLNQDDDRYAPTRIMRLRDRYGIEAIGSEFPEPDGGLADFGCAVDMMPTPRIGAPQGASLAEQHGLIPTKYDELWITLGYGWPDQAARMDYWRERGATMFLGNMDDATARAALLEVR